jgi:dipeptide/tripeptide permease
MIMYLTREYGMDAAQGAQLLLLFSSVTNFTPILGAVLADSYVGRYRMIGFGCMASLLVTIFLFPCSLHYTLKYIVFLMGFQKRGQKGHIYALATDKSVVCSTL